MKGVYVVIVIIAVILVILKYPQELRRFFIVLFKYLKGTIGKDWRPDIGQSVSGTGTVEDAADKNLEWDAINAQRDGNIKSLIDSQKQVLLELDVLKKKMDDLNNLLSSGNQKNDSIELKIGQMADKLQNLLSVAERQRLMESDNGKFEKADRQSSGKTLYAVGADSSSPLGFLAINLSDEFSNQFFEIERFSSDGAVFRFVDNYDMQKLLISSMYQLIGNGICEIEGECASVPSSIQVISDGKLRLKDGVWAITKKITLNLI